MKHVRLITFIFVLLIACLSAESQTARFSVKTEEVRIDVLVTDGNGPVLGLQASDFEVRDNGVLQPVQFAGFEQIPVSATLVFDMSASVTGKVLNDLKSAGTKLLDNLKPNDRAALVTFSNAATLEAPLTTDIAGTRKTLELARPYPFGDTSLIDASYAALILAESKSDRPLLIVFSDGLDNSSWLTDRAVLESAKRNNSVVYAVSAGHLPAKTFLRDLSNFTGGSLFEVESTKDLQSIFLSILKEFRQRYLLTYTPSNVYKGGWHQLKVRIKNRSAKIRTRPGYMSD